MTEKIILPAEVKVCATCSYWDGDRVVDSDMKVVVVAASCQGECLAQERMIPGLNDVRQERSCIWEHLDPDEPSDLAA
ncbi:MAG: hypothetical protein H6R10_3144 [Rhodocyclaceae bacterium]|nr:hypothetical protein [Rhodocyclaceae bacterium]